LVAFVSVLSAAWPAAEAQHPVEDALNPRIRLPRVVKSPLGFVAMIVLLCAIFV
jgi:hypothetical protein